jgi:hypothetical protein
VWGEACADGVSGSYPAGGRVRCMLAQWRADGVVIRQPPAPAEALSTGLGE